MLLVNSGRSVRTELLQWQHPAGPDQIQPKRPKHGISDTPPEDVPVVDALRRSVGRGFVNTPTYGPGALGQGPGDRRMSAFVLDADP